MMVLCSEKRKGEVVLIICYCFLRQCTNPSCDLFHDYDNNISIRPNEMNDSVKIKRLLD